MAPERSVITGRHAALYDRLAAGWALGWLYRAVAGRVTSQVPDGGSLLDVGTGPGRLLLEIARRRPDLRLFGVDPSADMVATAQRRARARDAGGPIHVSSGSAEALPFPDEHFDAVTSTLSGHHWADVDAAVTEQLRVLRAGGALWVFDLRGHAQKSLTASLHAQLPGVDVERRSLGGIRGALIAGQRVVKP